MKNQRSKIIIVDDSMSNLMIGKNLLKAFYEVFPAPSAAKLFEVLENVIPDLILLDIDMPEMNGFEAIKKIKGNKNWADIPVIFLTALSEEDSESEGFDLGAVDYILKPFSGPLLIKRIENQLLIVSKTKALRESRAKLKEYADNLEDKVREKTAQIFELQNAVLATVADLVEFRDNQTGGHIARTQLYLQALLEEMLREGVYEDEVKNWDMDFFLPSAQLHDVGKIGISDLILNKPGKLTDKEFEIMKTHVNIGVEAIEHIMRKTKNHKFLHHSLLLTAAHHEKWDGKGYPKGLKGSDIPIEGRLMAIADVYDALISVRPYKKAFTHEEACRIIEESAGTHFDPLLIEVFKEVEKQFKDISVKM